jgi:lipopolysaccharide/colanic/teichoic acid biosynthesis glycosyltransferase
MKRTEPRERNRYEERLESRVNAAETANLEPPPAQVCAVTRETEFVFVEKPVYDFVKRAFDVVFSFAVLLILALPLLAVMLAIRLSDGGSPIFVQERVGKNGKPFKMYKFRTMVVGAEEHLREVLDAEGVNSLALHKPEADSRVTKFGIFLRKTSIDEFPQFFNVLKGEMSVIGPRPKPPEEQEEFGGYFKRDVIKPGLSCYSVIDAKRNNSYDNYIQLDMEYIAKRSLPTDMGIFFATVLVLMGVRNF